MKYKVIKKYENLAKGTILERTGDGKHYSDNQVYLDAKIVEKNTDHFKVLPPEERKPLTADSFFG